MSIKLMTMMWDIEFPTQSQLLIALKLADFANDDGGSVYPSRDRISRNAQCSETTVKVVLRSFRSIGLLHVVREGGKGPKSTTEYIWNVGLLEALVNGECVLEGGGDELEIKWADKGAEFDPLTELRGRIEPLRGRNSPVKGAASRPQPFTTHQIDSSLGASAPATQGAARSTPAETARLVLPGDAEWNPWLNWLDGNGHNTAAAAFRAEGAMVIYDPYPSDLSVKPKLAPVEGSPRREALVARRGRSSLRDPSDGTTLASREATE